MSRYMYRLRDRNDSKFQNLNIDEIYSFIYQLKAIKI